MREGDGAAAHRHQKTSDAILGAFHNLVSQVKAWARGAVSPSPPAVLVEDAQAGALDSSRLRHVAPQASTNMDGLGRYYVSKSKLRKYLIIGIVFLMISESVFQDVDSQAPRSRDPAMARDHWLPGDVRDSVRLLEQQLLTLPGSWGFPQPSPIFSLPSLFPGSLLTIYPWRATGVKLEAYHKWRSDTMALLGPDHMQHMAEVKCAQDLVEAEASKIMLIVRPFLRKEIQPSSLFKVLNLALTFALSLRRQRADWCIRFPTNIEFDPEQMRDIGAAGSQREDTSMEDNSSVRRVGIFTAPALHKREIWMRRSMRRFMLFRKQRFGSLMAPIDTSIQGFHVSKCYFLMAAWKATCIMPNLRYNINFDR